jgi:hypothetical protein
LRVILEKSGKETNNAPDISEIILLAEENVRKAKFCLWKYTSTPKYAFMSRWLVKILWILEKWNGYICTVL